MESPDIFINLFNSGIVLNIKTIKMYGLENLEKLFGISEKKGKKGVV